MLTAYDISELNLKHARLAYLLACATAETKVVQLADEVIHTISGFQVAGFSHVIDHLWPPMDRICEAVASSFYLRLFWRGHTLFQDEDVATALRKSMMAVRAVDVERPLKWAQFVHYGA
jgi:CHAT domain-containing protein